MKDSALFLKAARENTGICVMAVLLMAFGALLLIVTSESIGVSALPAWFLALPLMFWRALGFFFAGAGLFASLLCAQTTRHGYRHYLIERYGVIRSATVMAKNVEEVSLNQPGSNGDSEPRYLRFGHVTYRYGMDGKTIEDSFILSETDIPLFEQIEIGDQIPVRVLPHKPRRSALHRERLREQYQRQRQESALPAKLHNVVAAALRPQ